MSDSEKVSEFRERLLALVEEFVPDCYNLDADGAACVFALVHHAGLFAAHGGLKRQPVLDEVDQGYLYVEALHRQRDKAR